MKCEICVIDEKGVLYPIKVNRIPQKDEFIWINEKCFNVKRVVNRWFTESDPNWSWSGGSNELNNVQEIGVKQVCVFLSLVKEEDAVDYIISENMEYDREDINLIDK